VKPAIGRIVHFKPGTEQRNEWELDEDQLLAAVIVRVWSDICVNLRVLLDGAMESPWVTSVVRGEDEHQWRWPERV
jgi:hypothetical protein